MYYQVYTHNEDGLIAGSLHWSRYMGDRQFGWLGLRPTCDTLLASDAFTQDFTVDGAPTRSALDAFRAQLEAMTARYRIGDGSGGTYVGPANNCAQDSNRALFATLRNLAAAHPDEHERFEELVLLTRDLSGKLQPFGTPRRDWTDNVYDLGTTMSDNPLQAIKAGLGQLARYAAARRVEYDCRNISRTRRRRLGAVLRSGRRQSRRHRAGRPDVVLTVEEAMTRRRAFPAAALALALLVGGPSAGWAQMQSGGNVCFASATAVDDRIAACSALIEANQSPKPVLAMAYFYRGTAYASKELYDFAYRRLFEGADA